MSKRDNEKPLVDIGLSNPVTSTQPEQKPRQDGTEGDYRIEAENFEEFYYIAKYVYNLDPVECQDFCVEYGVLVGEEATIYDVFEWYRLNLGGGSKYGPSLLERIDREIATEESKHGRR